VSGEGSPPGEPPLPASSSAPSLTPALPSPVLPSPVLSSPEPDPTEVASLVDQLDWGDRLRGFAAVAVAVALALYLTWSVLTVLSIAVVLGYLLDRPVTWIAARGMSRDMAFLLLLVVGGSALTLTGVVVVPLVVHQIGDLATNFTPYLDRLVTQIAPYKAELEARLGVAIPLDLSGLTEVAPEYLRKLASLPNAGEVAQEVVTRVAGGGAQVVLTVLSFALTPVFAFYVCRDWPHIVGMVDGLVPIPWRQEVREIATEIDTRITAFVKGQMILCLIMGVLYSVGLLISGIDLAVVVGMGSGLLFVVPYVGTLVGMVLSVVLALLKFGFDWHAVACVVTYVAVQGLEGSLLTPTIVGERVGLHPMVVMIGVVVCGDLLGIGGLMIAVPLTASLSVIAAAGLKRWKASRFFRGGA